MAERPGASRLLLEVDGDAQFIGSNHGHRVRHLDVGPGSPLRPGLPRRRYEPAVMPR
ncbi:hypothetical protein [Streptacidiphilus jiangxiensis]|uniref:hypothetical protein n=1 Tax=Streptacidiphilus jiangxiensis TaxID=235985 RepID=UPI000AF6FABC|nr:hypothetical protein [Streptacidiphilus jiangxiensis]